MEKNEEEEEEEEEEEIPVDIFNPGKRRKRRRSEKKTRKGLMHCLIPGTSSRQGVHVCFQSHKCN